MFEAIKAAVYIANQGSPLFKVLAVIALVFLFSIFAYAIGYRKKKHVRYRRYARQHLKKVRDLAPDRQFGYLRKVNPFIFEEMILLALKDAGHQVIHNKSYTGDGGIDGQAYIAGKPYLIQAKRYKSHIALSHVKAFAQLCKQRNCDGLFVHTGRTGKASRSESQINGITIVSGGKLLSLINGCWEN